jgi:hypothetical protein
VAVGCTGKRAVLRAEGSRKREESETTMCKNFQGKYYACEF